MDESKLELEVTRENGCIEQIRVKRGEEYIGEILPYLNKYGKIQMKDLLNRKIIEISLDFVDRDLEGLVIPRLFVPTKAFFDDIRSNYLKMTYLKSNYWINTYNKVLILDRSNDAHIVGYIKFFDRNREECSAQELYNNMTDGLYNESDLLLVIADTYNDLYLATKDRTILDFCSIDESSIKSMLKDENNWPLVKDDKIEELINIIYKKRSSLIIGKGRCPLGKYIKSKIKESNNEVK